MTHILCVMSSNKPIRIYMGGLILSVNTLFCFFKLFPMVGKRLIQWLYNFVQPLETRVCDTVDKDVIEIRMSDAQKMGVAGFLTEWGAYDNETVPGSKPYKDGLEITVSQELCMTSAYYTCPATTLLGGFIIC